jgi:hypothetical protein
MQLTPWDIPAPNADDPAPRFVKPIPANDLHAIFGHGSERYDFDDDAVSEAETKELGSMLAVPAAAVGHDCGGVHHSREWLAVMSRSFIRARKYCHWRGLRRAGAVQDVSEPGARKTSEVARAYGIVRTWPTYLIAADAELYEALRRDLSRPLSQR